MTAQSNPGSQRMSQQQVSWRENPIKRLLLGQKSPEYFEKPKQRLLKLRERNEELRFYRRLSFGIGTILLVVTALGYSYLGLVGSIFTGTLAVIAFVAISFFSTSDIQLRINDLDFELDVLQRLKGGDQSAYKLFRAHQLELRRYYRLTRRHSWIMLATGLFCISIGVLVIVIAGRVLLYPPEGFDGDVEQIIVGVLGAVGAILINYVAAIYMKMYGAVSQTLNDFHSRLVSTHHLHLANYLASRIDDDKTRYGTLKVMAEELAKA